jgi:hypothetical protein
MFKKVLEIQLKCSISVKLDQTFLTPAFLRTETFPRFLWLYQMSLRFPICTSFWPHTINEANKNELTIEFFTSQSSQS